VPRRPRPDRAPQTPPREEEIVGDEHASSTDAAILRADPSRPERAFGTHQPAFASAAGEDRDQHGRRRRGGRKEIPRRGGRRAGVDFRTEADHHPGP